MLHVLTHNILPVFALLALGFIMGRAKAASQDEARAVNRIAFLVLQPPLIFMLLTGLDLQAVRYDAIGIYFACEVIGFIVTFWIAKALFKCPLPEAWLMGMAVVFVNSLLYIWPISTLIYGESGAIPISAIVALDASVTFAFFIITMELFSGKSSDQSSALRAALPKILRNPILITIILSLTLNLVNIPIPEPIQTAARFAGAGAAPMTLFAMGVVLSANTISPNATIAGISAMKLLGFPALIWLGFATVSPENAWSDLFLLNSAGPSGAMAFSLALLHGVSARNIAPVIVWTSILSLFSLAWLA